MCERKERKFRVWLSGFLLFSVTPLNSFDRHLLSFLLLFFFVQLLSFVKKKKLLEMFSYLFERRNLDLTAVVSRDCLIFLCSIWMELGTK